MRQLHVQYRRLQLIDAEVSTDELVVVLGFPAVDPQNLHVLGEHLIVRDAHAGITEERAPRSFVEEDRATPDIAEAAGALVEASSAPIACAASSITLTRSVALRAAP